MKYYDVGRNWSKKIAPLLKEEDIATVLRKDFGQYTISRHGDRFEDGSVPADYDSCDWRCERSGRRPAFWEYVCHSACHWLVNFNMMLAYEVAPKRLWRIVTSEKHSTVFDGIDTLFDMNFLALGVKPDEAYELASAKKYRGRSLKPGRSYDVGYTSPILPSIAEKALRLLKGHKDYYFYLEVCHEAAEEGKSGCRLNLGITPKELKDILTKLKKESSSQ